MNQPNLDKVRVMIAEGGTLRRQIKTVLLERGFAQLTEVKSAAEVEDAVRMNMVDLLIADNDLDQQMCDVVHDVRHFKLGVNPFLVVVMVAGNDSRDATMRIINAGADDLLIKPITIGRITDRVMSLTQTRNKFIVTSDYIGPTRRTKARPEEAEAGVREIEVPNPVKDKANGVKMAEIDAAIVEATRTVNLRKLERDAYQVVWLTDKILPFYRASDADGEPDKAVIQLVNRLVAVSDEIGVRLKGTQFDYVGDLCGSLQTVASGIQASPLDPPKRELKLLPELANAVKVSLAGNPDEASVARDIASTVSGAA